MFHSANGNDWKHTINECVLLSIGTKPGRSCLP